MEMKRSAASRLAWRRYCAAAVALATFSTLASAQLPSLPESSSAESVQAVASAQQPVTSPSGVVIPPGADMIKLRTGSILFGILKKAEHGYVTFNIVGIGDTEIKIDEIIELIAPSAEFQVDVYQQPRTVGKLDATATPGQFTLSGRAGETYDLSDVSLLKRVELTLLERLDGVVAVGYTATSGSGVKQAALVGIASYTTLNTKVFAHLELVGSDKGSGGFDVDLFDTGLGGLVGLKGKWLGLQYLRYTEIPAVGLDSRMTSITAGRMRLIHNPVADLNLFTGLALQRERAVGGERSATKTEIPVVLDLAMGIPEYSMKLDATAIYYRGLSDSGRNRFDLRAGLSYEVFANFTLGLQYNYNYDSEPLNPQGDESNESTTVTVGYQF